MSVIKLVISTIGTTKEEKGAHRDKLKDFVNNNHRRADR